MFAPWAERVFTFPGLHTKSSCKGPLPRPNSSQAGAGKDHEPHQQPGKEAFLYRATGTPEHPCAEGVVGVGLVWCECGCGVAVVRVRVWLWRGQMSPSFASSSGMEDLDVMLSSSTAPPGKSEVISNQDLLGGAVQKRRGFPWLLLSGFPPPTTPREWLC